MKIIAAVPIGRYGRQYKPGDSLNVSPAHAQMYVLSKQARYPTKEQNPAIPAKPVRENPVKAPPSSQPEPQAQPEARDKPRKGRHRRRDMRAEGDGD